MQLVDGRGGDSERRIKTEGDIRAVEVVVNGLGNADDGQVIFFMKLLGDALGAVAADSQQHVDAVAFNGFHGMRRNVTILFLHAPPISSIAERIIPVGGAQDGPAPWQYAGNIGQFQFADMIVDQAGITVQDAADLKVELPLRGMDYGADDGVQSRAIAATGQNSQLPDFFHLDSSMAMIANKNITCQLILAARKQFTRCFFQPTCFYPLRLAPPPPYAKGG